MSVLQRGELEYVLNCIPVSRVSGQIGARDRDAADERESMLVRRPRPSSPGEELVRWFLPGLQVSGRLRGSMKTGEPATL